MSDSRYDRMVEELCKLDATVGRGRHDAIKRVLQDYGAVVAEAKDDLIWSAPSVNGDQELTLLKAAHTVLWQAEPAVRRRILGYLLDRIGGEEYLGATLAPS